MMIMKRYILMAVLVLLLVGCGAFCLRYYWVFGEGVKAGELNFITYKGYLFKTYEGRLIQAGLKGSNGTGGVQSNEFNFSVERKDVADSLMRCSGKVVELYYKEYKGALPWRGNSEFVVDSIVSVTSLLDR